MVYRPQLRPKQHGLNLGTSSPTKFVNRFSLFENLPTNHKEYPVSNKTFGEASSRIKKNAVNEVLKNMKMPMQLLHLQKKEIWNFE